jgi:glutamate racemase
VIGSDSPIGVFDSGVGGLSVIRSICQQMPSEDVIFFADQEHVPYGLRPLAEVKAFSVSITQFLLELRAKVVVVACNTASAAALHHLRKVFPDTPFVGMEPAIKPAAETTRTWVVGVLATPATFQGALYASVVERFANQVTLVQDTCPGLVQQIEKGELDAFETRRILESALIPMLKQGIDTVVLGCTHYPFVIPLIHRIVGADVRVIDPAPAVARQTAHVLEKTGKLCEGPDHGWLKIYTSGNLFRLQNLLPNLIDESAVVQAAHWNGLKIEADSPINVF